MIEGHTHTTKHKITPNANNNPHCENLNCTLLAFFHKKKTNPDKSVRVVLTKCEMKCEYLSTEMRKTKKFAPFYDISFAHQKHTYVHRNWHILVCTSIHTYTQLPSQ